MELAQPPIQWVPGHETDHLLLEQKLRNCMDTYVRVVLNYLSTGTTLPCHFGILKVSQAVPILSS
jgi:hypothetical protein